MMHSTHNVKLELNANDTESGAAQNIVQLAYIKRLTQTFIKLRDNKHLL